MDATEPNLKIIAEKFGMTPVEVMLCLGIQSSKCLFMSEKNQNKAKEIYDVLEKDAVGKQQKGKKLEELTALLFTQGNEKLIQCIANKRTSTNEIDLIVELSNNGKQARYGEIYKFLQDPLFVECKNYIKKVSVTYVGKFYSLLKISQRKYGVLVTWEGVTGKNAWTDSKGLIKKVALRESINIIVLDKSDLKRICHKEINLFELLTKKIQELELDISYGDSWNHELEHEFKEFIIK